MTENVVPSLKEIQKSKANVIVFFWMYVAVLSLIKFYTIIFYTLFSDEVF